VPQRVLTTDRLLLVPLAEEHLELEVELDSDPEVLRFLHPAARTRDQVVAAHARRMAEGRQVDGLGLWVGFLAHDDRPHTGAGPDAGPEGGLDGGPDAGVAGGTAERFVGLWMLTPEPDGDGFRDDEAELGYRLRRRHWRRGLASEGAAALLRHGFDQLGLVRVVARTMAVNTASRATMERLGLSFVRGFHEEFDDPVPGTEHGEVEYALTREVYAARRPRP